MRRGLIGNIGRYSLHDGPGIRTTVFFKGCLLHCPWCHNPELISSLPEVSFILRTCIGCGDCAEACPEEAIRLATGDRINRARCTDCGLCADACPSMALERVGREFEVEELVEILLRDRLYYETSGGGITLSGGEPTLQTGFAGELLHRLKQEGLHTAIETCGLFSWDTFSAACLDNLDLVLFDVKLADSGLHRKITGQDNGIILANLVRLLAVESVDVIARIPLVPGYTATQDNISRLATLFRTIGVRRYSLLAYHPWGLAKGERVGRTVASDLPGTTMSTAERDAWQRYFGNMELVEA